MHTVHTGKVEKETDRIDKNRGVTMILLEMTIDLEEYQRLMKLQHFVKRLILDGPAIHHL